MNLFCWVWIFLSHNSSTLSLNFMDMDSSYLIKYNWMICGQGSTLTTCALNVINLYPDCWADRRIKASQGFMFYNPLLVATGEFNDSDYIVQGFCYNTKITPSNNIMISRMTNTTIPKNCVEVKHTFPYALDGEYELHIGTNDDPLVLIYCHGMNTNMPSEYLTLPAGLERNVASTVDVIETSGSGVSKFEKIKINVETLEVARNDWTFARTDGTAVAFGFANGCDVLTNKDAGDCMIDLRGTRFSLNPETHNIIPYGHAAEIGLFTWSNNNRTVHMRCGGACGGCKLGSLLVLTMENDKDQFLHEGTTPKSCADIKKLYPLATDGEYYLYVQELHEPVLLYCHGLNTTAPKMFITLHAGSQYNYVVRSHPYGKVTFSKLRLKIRDFTLIGHDYTFASIEAGEHFIPYGWTTGCHSPEEINMNLTGTRFSFAPHIPGQLSLWGAGIRVDSVEWSADNKSSHTVCTAFCGGCSYTGYRNFLLISLLLD